VDPKAVREAIRDHAGLFTEHRPIDEPVKPTADKLGPWGVGLDDPDVILELMRYVYAAHEGAPQDVSESDLKFIAA